MRTHNLLRAFAALMLVLLVAAACGISLDESPRAIDNLPQELRLGQLPTPTPRPSSLSGPGSEQVYMLQSDRLVTVERQIVDTPEQLLEILLQSTFPEEFAEGISSAIFRGARVQGVEVNELVNLAIVDLAPGSLDPRNTEQRLAFAQFVYTLTSLPEIDSVRFVSTENPDDGPVDLAVQTDNGSTLAGEPVTREDFARLASPLVAQPEFGIPVATPTPTPDPDAPKTFDLPVWMLDENNDLVQVTRNIERTKEAFLVAVLEGPLLEEQPQIRSAFPPDALPNAITVDNYEVLEIDEFGFSSFDTANIAIVDLSAGSLPTFSSDPNNPGGVANAGDNEQLLAVAQIVFTLTFLEEIDQVVFSVDGELIPVPSDRGLSLPFEVNRPNGLQRADYASALPPVDADQPGSLGPVAEPTPTSIPTPTPTPTPGG